MKRFVLAASIILSLSFSLSAQEDNGKLNFESGILTGRTSAYSKQTFTIFFENVYCEFVKAVGHDSGLLGCGYDIGLTIAAFRLRPWLDENMFSIGWGYEFGNTKAKNRLVLTDKELINAEFPPEWKNAETWITENKLTFPLTYAKDFNVNWRVIATITPCISFPGCRDQFRNSEQWSVSTGRVKPYFDCDISMGICIKKYGLYFKYKPNLMWKKAFNADIQAVSVGFILTH